jgi:lipoyl-dependent peroxiredoxin
MAVQNASAEWNGTLKEGAGRMRVGSGSIDGPYTFVSRFETGSGTNPEELIGAAHAGCFSMALSAALGRAGHTPTSIRTNARVHLGTSDAGPTIDASQFQEFAEGAKKNCVVSRALGGVEKITLNARLK